MTGTFRTINAGQREVNVRGLNGKVAVVTGGGSGLGEAIGKALASNGVKVVLSDINLEAAERVAGEIGKAGARDVPS